MSVANRIIEALAAATPGGYGWRGVHYSEPTAWAALALMAAGEMKSALRACYWLARVQQPCGAVGISSADDQPAWPTALAMLAWQRWNIAADEDRYADSIERAMAWALSQQGSTSPRKRQIGHDTTIAGWSWAAATHSWLEPTAMFLRAGVELGIGSHPRFVDAKRLILDRQLPAGGWNYGNTIVLGQELLAHVQPTGIALWSLAATGCPRSEVQHSIDYLNTTIDERTTATSLGFAVMGLTAFAAADARHQQLLEAAVERALQQPTSTYKLSVLACGLQSLSQSLTSTPQVANSL
jgi:hypothetical protein